MLPAWLGTLKNLSPKIEREQRNIFFTSFNVLFHVEKLIDLDNRIFNNIFFPKLHQKTIYNNRLHFTLQDGATLTRSKTWWYLQSPIPETTPYWAANTTWKKIGFIRRNGSRTTKSYIDTCQPRRSVKPCKDFVGVMPIATVCGKRSFRKFVSVEIRPLRTT